MSFAQSLWALLRAKALPVSMIESLFRIRRNIFELASPKIALRAPTLLLTAVVYWAVSIAIIYPPGALIVQSEQFSYVAAVNASVMNPRPDMNTRDGSSSLLDGLADTVAVSRETSKFSTGPGTPGNFSHHYTYGAPTIKLQRFAKMVMFTGQIAALKPLGSVNPSYSLSFEGPQVRCRMLPSVNYTIDVQGNAFHQEIVFNTTWSGKFHHTAAMNDPLSPIMIVVTTSEAKAYFLAVNQRTPVIWESIRGIPLDNRTMSVIFEKRVRECDAYVANYSVDFQYDDGVPSITYNVSASSELQFDMTQALPNSALESNGSPNTNPAFLSCWQNYFGTTQLGDMIAGTFRLPDGREVNNADIDPHVEILSIYSANEYSILEDTIFNKERYKESEEYSLGKHFDPRTALDLSEDTINELLANVTISALSLQKRYANVAVNNTEHKSVYRFHQPLSLILPYGLCLAATLVFVIIGINALRLNGVPATDGGFLQILMTTGDTALNRAAAKGSLGATDAAPKELLSMKVRFANLNEGSATGAGFGTIEETTALERKGWRTKK